VLPAFPESQPSQWIDHESLGLSHHDVTHYVWLVTDGERFRGHAAVAALLRRQRPARWRFLGHLLVTPPFSWAAAVAYALIARFRHRLPGGTPACAMPRPVA
jgi:predicted DCC family thiol-disulfide oxidoreductase YuxK